MEEVHLEILGTMAAAVGDLILHPTVGQTIGRMTGPMIDSLLSVVSPTLARLHYMQVLQEPPDMAFHPGQYHMVFQTTNLLPRMDGEEVFHHLGFTMINLLHLATILLFITLEIILSATSLSPVTILLEVNILPSLGNTRNEEMTSIHLALVKDFKTDIELAGAGQFDS